MLKENDCSELPCKELLSGSSMFVWVCGLAPQHATVPTGNPTGNKCTLRSKDIERKAKPSGPSLIFLQNKDLQHLATKARLQTS
jgi:hypothetical protein